MKIRLKDNLIKCIFLVPSLFIFINVVIIPFITGIVYSFTDWNGFQFVGSKFVGLTNYSKVFVDQKFMSAFALTTKYTFVMIILVNLVGLGLALLVTSNFKSSNILRSVFFLPNLIGGLVLGFIWKFIFTKLFVELGLLLNQMDIFFDWLDSPIMAFWSLVLVGTWQMAGYVMIIYIASIQSIPDDVLEAASIDGANAWQKFKNITLPLITPAFTISLFFTLSNSFKQYDTNLSLTGGGPFGSTELITMNIFNTAFNFNQYSLAQAKAIVFFVVIMIFTIIQVSITKKREVEM